MSSCSHFQTPQGRRARCIKLGLCAACSGARHNTENCPAKKYGLSKPCSFCKSKSHISSLCTAGAKAADKSKSKLSEESVTGPLILDVQRQIIFYPPFVLPFAKVVSLIKFVAWLT